MTATTLRASLAMLGRTTVIVALAASLFVAGLGLGLGVMKGQANHSGDGLIHACVNNSTGAARIVGRPNQCRGTETLVEWNERGTPGSPGISGYEIVEITHEWKTDKPGDIFDPPVLKCPEGKNVLSGTVAVSKPRHYSAVTSYMLSETEWHGKVHNRSDTFSTPVFVTLQAVCANVS